MRKRGVEGRKHKNKKKRQCGQWERGYELLRSKCGPAGKEGLSEMWWLCE